MQLCVLWADRAQLVFVFLAIDDDADDNWNSPFVCIIGQWMKSSRQIIVKHSRAAWEHKTNNFLELMTQTESVINRNDLVIHEHFGTFSSASS